MLKKMLALQLLESVVLVDHPTLQTVVNMGPLFLHLIAKTQICCQYFILIQDVLPARSFLDLELVSNTYDIVLLTETHLDNTKTDSEIFPQGCTVFRCDCGLHGRHGGGILIAIGDFCKAYLRGGLCSTTSELEFVEIVFSNIN